MVLQENRNISARGRLARVNTENVQRDHEKKHDGKGPVSYKDLKGKFSQGLYSDT